MKSPFSFAPFRRLQWKLTLSYTAVTVGALLAVELLLFIVLFVFLGSDIVTNLVLAGIRDSVVPAAQPFFAGPTPDISGLQEYAQSLTQTRTQISANGIEESSNLQLGNVRLESDQQELYFLDDSLQLLAMVPMTSTGGVWPRPFDLQTVPGSAAVVANALQKESATSALATKMDNGTSLIAVPITDGGDRVTGVILLSFQIPLFESSTILPIVQAILITLIPLTIGAGIVGTLFGFLTARGLTRRLQNITQAANAWSEGDFSVTTRDLSGDELGQLNRTLTRMAEQLQNLLATHQELAMLEERNRLARELHDTVKQQVFATAMQLGTAKNLVESDPQAAQEHIAEAEQLVRQSQRELTSLIQELRPAALEGKGLAEAVQELADDWSRRSGIPTVVQVRGERPLPLTTEQTLFRIAQEALANVSRHSNARQVTIRIFWQANSLRMEINDDGTGFVPTAQKLGVGLPGMSERVAALSGRIIIDSAPGRGTTIGVTVPLVPEREQL